MKVLLDKIFIIFDVLKVLKRNPKSSIKLFFSLKNYKTLFSALKFESGDEIISNLSKKIEVPAKRNIINNLQNELEYYFEKHHIQDNEKIILQGWMLSSSNIDNINVYLGSKKIGNFKLTIERSDVINEFPKYNHTPLVGFSFVKKINSPTSEVLLEICSKTSDKYSLKTPLLQEDTEVPFLENCLSYLATNPYNFVNNQFLKGICVDVIIPVYNGFQYLDKLFESIQENTLIKHRLIIVEDKSSDERIISYLRQEKSKNENIILLENEKNLGFIGSVNKAVNLAQNHFVILNTDVVVTYGWLQKLITPIMNDPLIASCTPFSNSSTITSFPEFNSDNNLIQGFDLTLINECFNYISSSEMVEIPTGVGFCMAFNREVVSKIGMFDEIFGKGYAEENDWCRKAVALGYRNVLVPNTFVFHKHGGSFNSEEKNSLVSNNLKILNARHKDYNYIIKKFIDKDPLINYREFVKLLLFSKNETICIFDRIAKGGAVFYRNELIKQFLKEDKTVIFISYEEATDDIIIETFYSELKCKLRVKEKLTIVQLFSHISCDKLIINNLVGISNIQDWLGIFVDVKKITKCQLIFPVHDFHCICSSYTLLNNKGKYCDIPTNLNTCNKCLKKIRHTKVNETSIDNWRKIWEGFLKHCDNVTCFSNSSKFILLKAYPFLKNKIEVFPHEVRNISPLVLHKENSPLTIGVLGGINFQKGSHVILDLADEIEKRKEEINIVVIGELIDRNYFTDKNKCLKVTGKYDLINLSKIILDNKIDIFFIPSIWPETFSYTTEEIIQMQIPIIVFDIGAPAERVKKYNKGNVIEMGSDAFNILKKIKKLHNNNFFNENEI